jgi:CTP:molybdopterin cytidylyltransferase MocA
MTTTGIVLAAGAGRRYGVPKALVRDADGTPWLHTAVAVLQAAGCDRVIVALGARASEALELVPVDPAVTAIIVDDWQSGMAASLAASLAAATVDADSEAALITLVDLPGLPAAAARRVLGAAHAGANAGAAAGGAAIGGRARALRQAVYGGRPGHPVLIGRDHWGAVASSVIGDAGARAYLVANSVVEIECGDVFDGLDIDLPPKTSVL